MSTPGLDPDGKLTLEAKEAIRSYLIKIFVPSTVTLTIISAIVGYTIKDVAQKEALETALDAVSLRVLQTNAAAEFPAGGHPAIFRVAT
jgi:hypothetical protein